MDRAGPGVSPKTLRPATRFIGGIVVGGLTLETWAIGSSFRRQSDNSSAPHREYANNDIDAHPDCNCYPVLSVIVDAGLEANQGGYSERTPDENRRKQTRSIAQGAECGDYVSEAVNRDDCSQND